MARKPVQHNDFERPLRIALFAQLGAVAIMLLSVAFAVPLKRKS